MAGAGRHRPCHVRLCQRDAAGGAEADVLGAAPGAPVGIVTAPIGRPAPYMEGAQGLLDIAINPGLASALAQRLADIDTQRAAAIADNFGKSLADRGFSAKTLALTTEAAGSAIADAWDQPPEFGNVTAAMLATIEHGSSSFERAFFALQRAALAAR